MNTTRQFSFVALDFFHYYFSAADLIMRQG